MTAERTPEQAAQARSEARKVAYEEKCLRKELALQVENDILKSIAYLSGKITQKVDIDPIAVYALATNNLANSLTIIKEYLD